VAGVLVRGLLRHTVLRRVVTVTVLLLFTAVTAVGLPVVIVVSGPFALRPGGRGRPIRFGIFLGVYLTAESAGLLSAVWLWIRAGFGTRLAAERHQDANYALLTRILGWLYATAIRVFGLQIQVLPAKPDDLEPEPQAVADLPDRPLLVFSRHAGPGDSFLLIYAILARLHRRPRIVLKELLTLDPALDVLVSRMPHSFVGPGRGHVTEAIAQITTDMGPRDALIVFPEGANFTAARRRRAIAMLRLRPLGARSTTRRAQALKNVLPPHPSGVSAAIDAAPAGSIVAFVAHTGLDHLESVAGVWHGTPLIGPVEVTWWTIPADRVPAEPDNRVRWLVDNWTEVDTWIKQNRQPLERTPQP
jgi:1-acyl-sn-glycerol-3-phosphate acyltransferase